jgi:hypothetical protein
MVMLKLAGATTVQCNVRQKSAAPEGLEGRELQSGIEDDILISGESPEYSTLHAVMIMLFHACLKVLSSEMDPAEIRLIR